MQGHFCFIKSPIFEWLPEVDVSAICWIFDEACPLEFYTVKESGVKFLSLLDQAKCHFHLNISGHQGHKGVYLK